MTHTMRALRAQFRAVGKYHTPPELALKLRTYIPTPVDDTPPVDPWELEQAARRNTVRQLRDQIGMSRMVAAIERWPLTPFLDDLDAVIVEARATPLQNL